LTPPDSSADSGSGSSAAASPFCGGGSSQVSTNSWVLGLGEGGVGVVFEP